MRRSSGSCSATLRAPLRVAEGEPEASFQLVGLGEEHGVVASQRGPRRRQ